MKCCPPTPEGCVAAPTDAPVTVQRRWHRLEHSAIAAFNPLARRGVDIRRVGIGSEARKALLAHAPVSAKPRTLIDPGTQEPLFEMDPLRAQLPADSEQARHLGLGAFRERIGLYGEGEVPSRRCLSDMNSVCALDMTSMQMAGSIVSRLPTSGGFPFKPKRGQRLTNPGSISREDGDPVDKHGDKWQWDPIKIEWDVQHKDGSHTNIGPDGNITHGPNNTGRESQGGDANSFDTPLPRVSLTPQQLAQLSGGAMVAVLLGTLVVVAG